MILFSSLPQLAAADGHGLASAYNSTYHLDISLRYIEMI